MKVFISVQKMFNPTHLLEEMYNVLNEMKANRAVGVRVFFHKKCGSHDTTRPNGGQQKQREAEPSE